MHDEQALTPLPPSSQARGSDGWRDEIRATFGLAWPLAAANLLQMLVWAIDVMFIARLGTIPLAATSLAIALFGTIVWSMTGLTGMVSALIAAALGRGTGVVREVRRATRMALWLAVIAGLAIAGVCQFGEELLLLAGQDAGIAARADTFLAIIGFSAAPLLIANVLRSYVSALGRPVFATMIVGVSVAVAALGNYALVFGNFGFPALGMEGSAIASIITAWAAVIVYALVIMRNRKLARFHIFGRLWVPDWSYFRRLVRLGLPVALTIVAEAGVFNGAAFMMGLIGPAELGGHTLALQIAAFAFQVPFGVAQAATIRVGYFYGAGDRNGMARAGWAAIIIGTGFMVLTASAMLLAPMTLLQLYLDPYARENEELVGFALQFMMVAAAFQLFDGLQAVAAGSLRGLQDTRSPMIVAILGFWLAGFPTMVGLGFYTPLEGLGVWIGLLVGLFVVAALLLTRWVLRDRFGLTVAPLEPANA